MSGYRISLDIAKRALGVSQNNMAITGHNISNVSTPGYSRQTASNVVSNPMNIGSLQFGRGATIETINRHSNSLLDERLLEQRSQLAADEEGLMYINNLEGLFDIQSEHDLSAMISDFWNTWHDLSNNPSGVSERAVIYENGMQLAGRLQNMNQDLMQLEDNISQEIETGVGQLNDILDQIAGLNAEINLVESSGRPANDQRDARGVLVTEVAEIMSINTIEQPNGFLTILSDGGYPMVIGKDSYPLKVDGGRVLWPTSSGGVVDISDKISSGKISGWLDMKEEEVAQYRRQIDTISKELIWQVNSIHSQGVGLKYISTEQNGSYTPYNIEGGPLSTLDFGQKIDYTKDFKMWTRDANNPPNSVSVEVDMNISDTDVTYVGVVPAPANAEQKYFFTVTTAGTVGLGGDDPVITWEKADYGISPPGPAGGGGIVPIGVAGNFTVDGITLNISSSYLTAGNTFTLNTNAASDHIPLNVTNYPELQANSVLDNYIFQVVSGGGDLAGVSPANPMVIQWENSHDLQTITIDGSTNPDGSIKTFEIDGMALEFNSGVLFDGDVFTIRTDEFGHQLDDAGAFSMETSSEWHWTVDSFRKQFNTQSAVSGANVTAYRNLDGSLKFDPDYGSSFAFSDNQAEDSGLMAALGINTFFTGDNSNNIGVKDTLEFVDYIAAARIDGGDSDGMVSDAVINDPAVVNLAIGAGNDTFRFEEEGTSYNVTLDTVTYTSTTDLNSLAADIQSKMNIASTLGPPDTYKVVYDEFNNQFAISENDGSNVSNLEIFWSENPATADALGFKRIDKVYLPPAGDYGVSNNENSLAMADAQYEDLEIAKWNFHRGQDNRSDTVSTHIEGSYQDMLSGLGVKGAALNQSVEFGEVMVVQLTQLRETVSGVSIDEEMIKLISYQQSYTAASKLITTIDEMLQTLLAVK